MFRIQNNIHHEWVKKFCFDYDIGKPVKIAVNVFDKTQKGNNKSVGLVFFEVGMILGSKGNIKA